MFENVLQFPHVARPVVVHENGHRPWRDGQNLALPLGSQALQKELYEQRDIGLTLPQRREVDRNHVQAVVQILSELSLAHEAGEIAMGGGDHADVHLDGLVAAESLELLLLQDPQQLDLDRGAEISDLVQEDGPLVGQLESPLPLPDGARERPFLVAEQLALQ
jgi:hypothetical protein